MTDETEGTLAQQCEYCGMVGHSKKDCNTYLADLLQSIKDKLAAGERKRQEQKQQDGEPGKTKKK